MSIPDAFGALIGLLAGLFVAWFGNRLGDPIPGAIAGTCTAVVSGLVARDCLTEVISREK